MLVLLPNNCIITELALTSRRSRPELSGAAMTWECDGFAILSTAETQREGGNVTQNLHRNKQNEQETSTVLLEIESAQHIQEYMGNRELLKSHQNAFLDNYHVCQAWLSPGAVWVHTYQISERD